MLETLTSLLSYTIVFVTLCYLLHNVCCVTLFVTCAVELCCLLRYAVCYMCCCVCCLLRYSVCYMCCCVMLFVTLRCLLRCAVCYVTLFVMLRCLFIITLCFRDEFPCMSTHVLTQHVDQVWFCRFSPDGTMLATGIKNLLYLATYR